MNQFNSSELDRIVEVPGFRTSDGQIFDKEDDAYLHENLKTLDKVLPGQMFVVLPMGIHLKPVSIKKHVKEGKVFMKTRHAEGANIVSVATGAIQARLDEQRTKVQLTSIEELAELLTSF